MDASGNLYVLENFPASRIQMRDPDGVWTVIAGEGAKPGEVKTPYGIAVDSGGNLYVAEGTFANEGNNRIQKRDAKGNWTVLATAGRNAGQVWDPHGLAVDAAGKLYVAGTGNAVVQVYTSSIDPILYGDVDGDGALSITDATACLRLVVDPSKAMPEAVKRADVSPKNGDGTFGNGVVEVGDAVRILRRLVNLDLDPWP